MLAEKTSPSLNILIVKKMNNIYQYNIFFQAQEFIAMFIDMGDGQGVREVVDETPVTFEEAVMLAVVIASFYAHPNVH